MVRRVTIKDLESIVERINRTTGSPLTSYVKSKDGKYTAQIGNYHIDGAYGGYALYRMHNDGGGVEDVLRVGHVSKPELQRLLFAFINGLESSKQEYCEFCKKVLSKERGEHEHGCLDCSGNIQKRKDGTYFCNHCGDA